MERKQGFANPHPDWVFATLDVESLFSHATPVVVAVTVGKAGLGVKRENVASVQVPGRFAEPMVVRAADTGQPIPGARLEVALADGERTYPFGTQPGRRLRPERSGPSSHPTGAGPSCRGAAAFRAV